jgi:ArsR family transcriptional regulator
MASAAPQPDALLSWMAAFADATRLRLLRLLEKSELGVAELMELLQLPQSTVSRHLKVLADQGLVKSRAEGANRLYRMPPIDDAAARRLWLLAKEQTEGWATARQDRLRLLRLRERQKPSTLRFFAGAAGRWDQLRGELYGEAFSQDALVSLLPRHWIVADLGCGSGKTAAALAPYVRRVIGVDQSAAMLKAARRRTADLSNVELKRGSLESLPLKDDSVDGVLLLLALTYVAEPLPVLQEAARVLRPGGSAVVVDLLRHDREEFRRQMGQRRLGFEPEELTQMMGEAGLAAPVVRPLAPEPQAKGPALLLASASRPGRVIALKDDKRARRARNAKEQG